MLLDRAIVPSALRNFVIDSFTRAILDQIYSQRICLLARHGKGYRISCAPVQQIPANCKEPDFPRSRTMSTNGNPLDQIPRRLRGLEVVAEVGVLDRIFSTHGLPKTLASDNGTQCMIQINPTSCVRGKIPGQSINGSTGENGERSDAAKENSAEQEEGQLEGRDYLLGRQWTAAIITNRHESMIYDVNVKGQNIAPRRGVRTRLKPSRLQVDPSSKTYG
ncbi:hypothetical protein ACTXT7_008389 [Hymenolepis weldensis]